MRAYPWKNRATVVATVFVAGVFVGVTGTVASATVADSGWKNTDKVGTTQYSVRSVVDDLYHQASVTSRASKILGTGKLGALAFLMESDGSTCKYAGMTFSNSDTSAWARYTSGDCGSGTYYGVGTASYYNQGSYVYNKSWNSPYISW